MPINPNIAMAFKPVEFQQADPLRDYAAVAQIQNAQLQNQLARQQMEQEQGVTNYLRGGANLATPEGRAGLRQFGKTGLAYEKLLADQEMATLKRKEIENKIQSDRLSALGTGLITTMNNPSDENLTAAFDRIQSTGVDVTPFRQQLLAMPLDQRQAAITQYAQMHPEGQKALAFVQPKPKEVRRADGSIIFMDENPNSPTFKQEIMPAQAAGMTPYQEQSLGVQRGQLGVSQGQLRLAQEQAVKPVFNAAAGGFVAPPTAANPQGTFTPVKGIQETKDQEAAVKALRSAGYDPTTGEDNISKLIKKSTSGGLEAMTSGTLAFFGKTTEGRKAISALAGTANQIATDLAGGKLGAGISNTDRDFIVSALGDVANPSKTADERLAGWNAAKDRMLRAGLIPPPKGSAVAGPKVGTVQDGYRFKGGNPADPSSWEKQ